MILSDPPAATHELTLAKLQAWLLAFGDCITDCNTPRGLRVLFPYCLIRPTHVGALLVFAAGRGTCAICGGKSGEPRHELRLLAGYSPFSTTIIGTATNRQYGLAEVSYSQRCWSWNPVSVSYTAGIEPAAVLRQPPQIESISNQGIVTVRSVPSHAVYGFAVMPFGFFAQFARRRRVHPWPT
jgi:hypothetical protein